MHIFTTLYILIMNCLDDLITSFPKRSADYPSLSQKQRGLNFIHTYIHQHGEYDIFSKIISHRIAQIQTCENYRGNLHQTFTSDIANQICGHSLLDGLPEIYLDIEKLAISLFGNILSCWAEYESYKILGRVQHYQNNHMAALNRVHTCAPNEFISEIVMHIEKDERLFMTHHYNKPMLLSDAIVLTNIETFIKEQHWYEMLYYLNLSQKGQHFIMLQGDEDGLATITSTALIQGWELRDNWLTFNPFFQNSHWQVDVNEKKLNALRQTGIFSDALSFTYHPFSILEFETQLADTLIDDKAICEVLRLTVSGPSAKRQFFLYQSQKMLMKILHEQGKPIVFTIIEQPSMILFYQALNRDSHTELPYINTAYQDVNASGLVTYKGFWLTKHLSELFKQNSFKDYKKKVIGMRRAVRETTNA
ncbi:acyl-homoserine-lactone synthase [Photobacterium kishitanii]|uniref:acyl-homoserine-lactone synthase n=1 Tax=Photobacterium kishitanii TaxID=318456 RepID=A0A2T3KGW4_9GAMM|nr:acyl-homoserine-lactone synthase [Photobacterium kishitanii]PSU98195.1 autoinducer synthase [Photobacterium kishitanii]